MKANRCRAAGARLPLSEVIRFVKEHKEECGGEPIGRVLQIAPSNFYVHLAVASDPDKASDRAKREAGLPPEWKRDRDDSRVA